MSDPFAVSGGDSGGEQRGEDVGLEKALSCPYIYTSEVPHLLSQEFLRWALLRRWIEASAHGKKSDIAANQGK